MGVSVIWTRDKHDELHWRRWGPVSYAFHPASGRTHFLNELGERIVELIEQSPRSADEVVRLLSSEYELTADAALDDAVEATLRALDNLGLISPRGT